MKISTLAVFTALMCCAAFKPCSAQILVIGDNSAAHSSSSSATFEFHPVSSNEDPPNDPFASETTGTAASEQAAPIVNEAPSITNPFDNFSTADGQHSEGQATGNDSASAAQGQPIGRHHRQQAGERTMVDTILHYGAYNEIPNADYMPIQWPNMNGMSSPSNPIGHYMLQNWCVDGLWSSYPAQRAAQCQAIQNGLSGCSHNHCNRYLLPGFLHGARGCSASACGTGARCGNAACNTCEAAPAALSVPEAVPTPAAAARNEQFVAPVSLQVPTPATPIDPEPAETENVAAHNIVAQLPAYLPEQQIR